MSTDFKSLYSLPQRKEESRRVRERYSDRIPVICQKHLKSKIGDIDKIKYLVPNVLNVGQFIYTIRNRLKLKAEEGLFLFVNGTIPATTESMISIFNNHKDEDGFLYVSFAAENRFG